ncbi:MAG: NifB/NifX family molybdenum-iron cluster-binding protein [Lentisphaeria bacterium]|nr:NifB/NifX family molybdenum-iron cluster-binding protein [Lentisphaeria bacterium]
MIIAVTSENGEVFQHFGHTPEFTIYETKDGELFGPRIVSTGENGHGALAGILDSLGVDVLICGGIGGGAQMALDEVGVKIVGGASGNVGEAVKGFIAGTLQTRDDFRCRHHEHDANHRCGEHGCGSPDGHPHQDQ